MFVVDPDDLGVDGFPGDDGRIDRGRCDDRGDRGADDGREFDDDGAR